MQGRFSKIRRIFDSIRSVTTTEDQGPGRWERAIDMGSEMQINQKSTVEYHGR